VRLSQLSLRAEFPRLTSPVLPPKPATRLFHALVPIVCRFILSPLRKLGAVFGILQIVLRLFHGCPPVEEDVGDQKSGSIGTKLRFGQPDDYPFRLTAARRWRGGDDAGDHDRAITNKVYKSLGDRPCRAEAQSAGGMGYRAAAHRGASRRRLGRLRLDPDHTDEERKP
jgi:hypothetical protein